jgi:uncharacterized protein YggE
MRRSTVLALALVTVLAGCSSGSDEPRATPSRITVHASGRTRATPDLLTVTLGVETRAARAKDALADNNRRAAAVHDVLRARGVKEDDVQTSQVSVSPDYDQRGRITGFLVDNVVTARLRALDRAGELLDAVAGTAGDAVRVNGLAFSIDDPEQAAADARADAVRRARAQAKQLAEAAGVRLGRLHSLQETPASDGSPSPYATDRASGAAASSVPLAPGSLEVRVSVDLVYDIAA